MRETHGASEAEQTRRPESDPAPQRAPIQVQFEIERADLEEQMVYLGESSVSAKQRRNSLLVILIGGAGLGWILFVVGRSTPKWLGLGLYAVFVGYLVLQMIRSRKKMPSKAIDILIESSGADRILGPTTITIDAERVSQDDGLTFFSTAWSRVDEIERADDVVYLRTGKLSAFFVPRRAFDDGKAFDEFATAARQWRSQSPSAEDTCPECRYSLKGLGTNGCPECGWRREPKAPPVVYPQ